MKKLVALILAFGIAIPAFAARMAEVNSLGVLAIGKDGNIYMAKGGKEFKPFLRIKSGAKVEALTVNSKSMFALGEDNIVYKLSKAGDDKFELAQVAQLPKEMNAVDIEMSDPSGEKGEYHIIVVTEEGKIFLLSGENKTFKEILTIPGYDKKDDNDKPENPDDPFGGDDGSYGK